MQFRGRKLLKKSRSNIAENTEKYRYFSPKIMLKPVFRSKNNAKIMEFSLKLSQITVTNWRKQLTK